MPVASLALGQHLAAGDIQGREQGGGSMPDIVVGDAFDIAQSHRQHRLSALKRLDLAFFVDAQHHGVIRRVQIQSDDVAHFLDEERVVGQFEGPLPVRLHAEQLEPARHGAFGDAAVLGHGTDRPVGRIGRGRLQRRVDDLGHPFVLMGAGTSRAQLVVQSFKALRKEAPAPFADGEWTQPKAPGDGGVRLAFGAGQNDLRAADDAVGEGAGVGEGQQLGLVVFAEGEGGKGSAARHERTPVNDDAPYYMTYLWDRTLATSAIKHTIVVFTRFKVMRVFDSRSIHNPVVKLNPKCQLAQ